MSQQEDQKDIRDVLKFLYEQRLILFNTRRGHEWEIIFRVLALIGAVDAALLTGKLTLPEGSLPWWILGIAVIFFATLAYEWGVQSRNRVDRVVMDRIQDALCHSIEPVHGHVRVCADSSSLAERVEQAPKRIWKPTFLWAFLSQVVVLIVAFSITALVFMQAASTTPQSPKETEASCACPASPPASRAAALPSKR